MVKGVFMTKFYSTAFLFVFAACIAAFAQGVPSPSEPRLMIDANGTLISAANPLPTTAAVTIGSISVTLGVPPDKNLTSVISATVTAQNVASLANRKNVNFFNHSGTVTCWISLDSVTASAAANVGIPLFPYGFAGFELDASKIVGVYAAGVASVTVYQDGY